MKQELNGRISFFNRINFRILAILLILLVGIAIIVGVLNQSNIRRVYENIFTDRVLMTNSLIANNINSDDVGYFVELLRNQDDAFKARQIQFFHDREELFALQEEGVPDEELQDLFARLTAFHEEMAALKTDRYWNTIEALRQLRDISGSEYVYIISDTGLVLDDGTVLFTFIFDADDYGVYTSPDMDGLGTSNVAEESAIKIFTTKTQMEEVEYYLGDYGELYYAYAPIIGSDGEVVAILGTDLELQAMYIEIDRSLILFNAVFIISSVIIIFIIYVFIRRNVTSPLSNLTDTAHELAEGNVYAVTPENALRQKSEIGVLAHAIYDMSQVYQNMIKSSEKLFDAANVGKLDVRNDVSKYKGDIQKVIKQINDILDATTLYLDSIPESIFIMSKDYELYFRNERYLNHFGEMTGSEFMEYVSSQDERAVWINDSCYSVILKKINLNAIGDSSILVIAVDITDLIFEKERAQAAAKAKSDFLSRMSHEMRTPMNAVIGMTKIAEKTNDIDKLKYCLSTIETSSVHLLDIINDVLDMSKIEAGKFELESAPMKIQNMVDKVKHIVNENMKRKKQKFSIEIDDVVDMIFITDELRLSQVIMNLLANASKFTPENGSISLNVKKVSQDRDVCTLSFAVIDTGIGLTEEQISRLFNAFEQADSSVTRLYGGTGLGLAISSTIIEKMGGRIWVESNPEGGSVFIFEVPLEIAADQDFLPSDVKAMSVDEVRIEVPDLSDLHILLVDDVDINREIFIALVEDTKISIDSAENGLVSVTKFKENPDLYDMIIMDVQMPVMDGYEATRKIRALNFPKAKTIPIIAMTANAFKEDIESCLESGMNDHLAKPIDEKQVIEKIIQYTANHSPD